MQSKATTVSEYLNKLPPDRASAVSVVRKVILANLPKGYAETMNWGMISYEIPLEIFPDTYNNQPLMYAALASQKQYISLYMMGVYSNPDQLKRLQDAFIAMDVKPNMGKSCIRFKDVNQIPLDTVGQLISEYSVEDYLDYYHRSREK